MSDRWVSVSNIAEHLGIGRDRVCRWIEAKGLMAYRFGRHWKLKLEEFDQWVREGGAGKRGGGRRGSEN